MSGDYVSFSVGENGKKYGVDARVYSKVSPSLGKMLKEKLAEATESAVDWSYVGVPTFERFTMWVRTGLYLPPEPKTDRRRDLAKLGPEHGPEHPLRGLGNWGERLGSCAFDFHVCPDCRSTETSRSGEDHYRCWHCRSDFDLQCQSCNAQMSEGLQTLVSQFIDAAEVRYPFTGHIKLSCRWNRDATEDHTEVFLCHAYMYILADVWDIEKLRERALYELHMALTRFIIYPARIGDLITLAEYVFDYTLPGDAMYQMLVMYLSCIWGEISHFQGPDVILDDRKVARGILETIVTFSTPE